MEGLRFWHGTAQAEKEFSFPLAQSELKQCVAWAKSGAPEDARASAGVQPLAAIRAWTGQAVCYVVTSVLRDKGRTAESVGPVLPLLKLFLRGLHSLPPRFLYRGPLCLHLLRNSAKSHFFH